MEENKAVLTPQLFDGIRVVWIDLDDTIWDFRANSRVSLRGLYRDYALAEAFPTPEEWIACYEKHNHALWDQYNHGKIEKDYLMKERFLRPLLEGGHPRAVELGQRFDREYLDRLAECTELIPGAVELLERLRSNGYRTGILSNGFVEVQHRKIRNSGLSPLIDYIVLSDDIGVNKPDVRLYRHAQQIAGVTASECLMIGDNPDTDIAGALNAGWKAIFFDRNCSEPASDAYPTVNNLDTITQRL